MTSRTSKSNGKSNPYNTTASSSINKIIGDFKICAKIGQGTFSKVCQGIYIPTGEKVAIKIMSKDQIKEKNDRIRIEKEIIIQKKLHHQNIIQQYAIIDTENTIYIISEYCSGGDLFDYIVSKRKLYETEACRIYQQLISGLEYLHKQRICHRDLKPENLLFDYKHNLKIADFGLSNDYHKGKMSTPCGSPCYAAPEMILGRKYSGASVDIWSSGIVLYTMVCGFLPFEDENQNVLFGKIAKGLFSLPTFLSSPCKDLLKKILVTDPNKRYGFEEIKHHPWFMAVNNVFGKNIFFNSPGVFVDEDVIPIDIDIIFEIFNNFNYDLYKIISDILKNKHNKITTIYYLILKRKIKNNEKSVADISSNSIDFIKYIKSPKSKMSFWNYDYDKIIKYYIKILKNKLKNELLSETNVNDLHNNNRLKNNLNKNEIELKKINDINKQNGGFQLQINTVYEDVIKNTIMNINNITTRSIEKDELSVNKKNYIDYEMDSEEPVTQKINDTYKPKLTIQEILQTDNNNKKNNKFTKETLNINKNNKIFKENNLNILTVEEELNETNLIAKKEQIENILTNNIQRILVTEMNTLPISNIKNTLLKNKENENNNKNEEVNDNIKNEKKNKYNKNDNNDNKLLKITNIEKDSKMNGLNKNSLDNINNNFDKKNNDFHENILHNNDIKTDKENLVKINQEKPSTNKFKLNVASLPVSNNLFKKLTTYTEKDNISKFINKNRISSSMPRSSNEKGNSKKNNQTNYYLDLTNGKYNIIKYKNNLRQYTNKTLKNNSKNILNKKQVNENGSIEFIRKYNDNSITIMKDKEKNNENKNINKNIIINNINKNKYFLKEKFNETKKKNDVNTPRKFINNENKKNIKQNYNKDNNPKYSYNYYYNKIQNNNIINNNFPKNPLLSKFYKNIHSKKINIRNSFNNPKTKYNINENINNINNYNNKYSKLNQRIKYFYRGGNASTLYENSSIINKNENMKLKNSKKNNSNSIDTIIINNKINYNHFSKIIEINDLISHRKNRKLNTSAIKVNEEKYKYKLKKYNLSIENAYNKFNNIKTEEFKSNDSFFNNFQKSNILTKYLSTFHRKRVNFSQEPQKNNNNEIIYTQNNGNSFTYNITKNSNNNNGNQKIKKFDIYNNYFYKLKNIKNNNYNNKRNNISRNENSNKIITWKNSDKIIECIEMIIGKEIMSIKTLNNFIKQIECKYKENIFLFNIILNKGENVIIPTFCKGSQEVFKLVIERMRNKLKIN